MKHVSSSTLGIILDDPEARLRLHYSWPRPKCCVCGREAQGVYEVLFHIRPRPDGKDELVTDWFELRLGCHACFTSDYGKGVKPEAELPFVWPPLYPRRKRINFVLAITCLSTASKAMQEVLRA